MVTRYRDSSVKIAPRVMGDRVEVETGPPSKKALPKRKPRKSPSRAANSNSKLEKLTLGDAYAGYKPSIQEGSLVDALNGAGEGEGSSSPTASGESPDGLMV
jgi:hypothetical protein